MKEIIGVASRMMKCGRRQKSQWSKFQESMSLMKLVFNCYFISCAIDGWASSSWQSIWNCNRDISSASGKQVLATFFSNFIILDNGMKLGFRWSSHCSAMAEEHPSSWTGSLEWKKVGEERGYDPIQLQVFYFVRSDGYFISGSGWTAAIKKWNWQGQRGTRSENR